MCLKIWFHEHSICLHIYLKYNKIYFTFILKSYSLMFFIYIKKCEWYFFADLNLSTGNHHPLLITVNSHSKWLLANWKLLIITAVDGRIPLFSIFVLMYLFRFYLYSCPTRNTSREDNTFKWRNIPG